MNFGSSVALLSVLLGTACGSAPRPRTPAPGAPRVLCVVAHPDDEASFACTLFKIATHLGGVCDIVVITNGEAGYRYTTLAEVVYRRRLVDPVTGRSELPALRQREMREAADVLHVRDVVFLSEQDHRYTLDPNEVLGPGATVWNLPRVRAELARALERDRYDFVFGHLPNPKSHGHHQAATILALEAIAALPMERRPVPLGSFGRAKEPKADDPPPPAFGLDGFPITRQREDVGPWTFDCTQPFGFEDKLDYRIVKAWNVAAHKTQGRHQRLTPRGELETFRLFALDVPDAAARADALFRRLAEPQFLPVRYDAQGNLLQVE